MKNMATRKFNLKQKYGFSMPEVSVLKFKPGLNRKTVKEISRVKAEPVWMKNFRLKAFDIFLNKKMPSWGPDLSKIASSLQKMVYFNRAVEKQSLSWQDLPKEIRKTYEKIGIPKAERNMLLSGTSAQYDSEVVYESVLKELKKQGVIFCDMDTAVKKYPKILKQYFGKLVPAHDNKFSALNSAVWSGGSFIYIPKNVRLKLPLQAYFRINAQNFGQFERTLIVAEPGSEIHYVEGCTAPIYNSDSLHAAVVEIFVKEGARVRYTTIQNWSKNVYNLVTKRAKVEKNGLMEWVDCNIGSGVTMKYPACYLMGKGARGEMLSIAFAGQSQFQDVGAKMFHFAPETCSRTISKSISKDGGRSSFRGLVQVFPGAKNSKVYTSCNALILDKKSRSDTYPTMRIKENETVVEHEATVEKISTEKLFYLNSRGINKEDSYGLLVNGFIEPVIKEIPLEYAVELNRLINLEMTSTTG